VIREVTGPDLAELVGSGPILLDFWAPDCGRCHSLRGQLEIALDRDPSAGDIYAINVRAEPEIAEKYGVMSLPTVLILDGGTEVERFTDPILSTKLMKSWRAHRSVG
jgi:thioredoxin